MGSFSEACNSYVHRERLTGRSELQLGSAAFHRSAHGTPKADALTSKEGVLDRLAPDDRAFR